VRGFVYLKDHKLLQPVDAALAFYLLIGVSCPDDLPGRFLIKVQPYPESL